MLHIVIYIHIVSIFVHTYILWNMLSWLEEEGEKGLRHLREYLQKTQEEEAQK